MTIDDSIGKTLTTTLDRELGKHRNGAASGSAPAMPLAVMLDEVARRNDDLKAHVERVIEDLRALRELL